MFEYTGKKKWRNDLRNGLERVLGGRNLLGGGGGGDRVGGGFGGWWRHFGEERERDWVSERESSIGVLVVEIAVWLSLAVFYMTRFYQNTNIIPQVTRVYEVFWALAVFSAQFELVGSRL